MKNICIITKHRNAIKSRSHTNKLYICCRLTGFGSKRELQLQSLVTLMEVGQLIRTQKDYGTLNSQLLLLVYPCMITNRHKTK